MTDLNQTDWNEVDASNNSAPPNGWPSGTFLPSNTEPAARAMRGALKRWHNQISPVLTSGGTANVQTLTHTQAHGAYVTGDIFSFVVGVTNTGSTTLNVDTLGAKTLKRHGASLVGGELQLGAIATCAYDGTNLQLLAVSSLPAPATVNVGPSNPAASTSASRVMMGLGDSGTITPTRTGIVVFMVAFNVTPNNASGGTNWHLRYGTGTRPVNGAAETGTAAMAQSNQGSGNQSPTLMGVVTGLTVGTAYWFDVSIGVVAPVTSTSLGGVSMTAFELSR
jgi:hypothetical protein